MIQKKFFVIACFFLFSSSRAQISDSAKASLLDRFAEKNTAAFYKDTTFEETYFLWIDYQQDYAGVRTGRKVPQGYGAFIWASYSRGPIGMTFTGSFDRDGMSEVTIGVMYNTTTKKGTYYECNISPVALQFPMRNIRDQPAAWAPSAYIYIETKSDNRIAKGKLLLSVNGTYYVPGKEYWYQGYATVSLLKCFSLGAFVEYQGAIGIRAQGNIRIGKEGVLSIWTAGRPQYFATGINYSYQFSRESSKKKRK